MKKLKGTSIVKCRVCKGDHWTTKCPYKESLQPLKEIEEKEKQAENSGGEIFFLQFKVLELKSQVNLKILKYYSQIQLYCRSFSQTRLTTKLKNNAGFFIL